MSKLTDRLSEHLKGLRKADTQTQAIKWMTEAYRLMEEAIVALEEKPEVSTIERLIFLPTERKIEVVQMLPVIHRCPAPPTAKAWTHRDTLRLERKH